MFRPKLSLAMVAAALLAPAVADAAIYTTTFRGTASGGGVVIAPGQNDSYAFDGAAFTATTTVNGARMTRTRDLGLDDLQGGGAPLQYDDIVLSLDIPSQNIHVMEYWGVSPNLSFDLAETYDEAANQELPFLGAEGSTYTSDSSESFSLPGFGAAAMPGNLDLDTSFQAAHGDWVVPGFYKTFFSGPTSGGGSLYYSFNADFSIDSVDHRVTGGPGDTPGAIPEPAAWTLMIVGFAGAGAVLRRRRAAATAP